MKTQPQPRPTVKATLDEHVRLSVECLDRLPVPLEQADRQAGYTPRLLIWQMEYPLTQVFDRPVHGGGVLRGSASLENSGLLFPNSVIDGRSSDRNGCRISGCGSP